MTSHFRTIDGLSLAYADSGSGPAILCLSGLTRNMSDFEYLLPFLAGVRVIRMDYRGRGASEWARDPLVYTVENEARDAIALLDHLGIERAAIIGTSRGGLIAMRLAETDHGRLAGVCLNDIGPEVAPAGLAAIMSFLGRPPQFTTLQDMAAAMPAAHPGFADVPPGRWLDEARHRYEETPQGLRLRYDPRLRDAVLAAAGQPAPDLWARFDALEGLPLALVRGANSDLLAQETVGKMQRRRPDMIVAEVPGRGHVPFLDEPAALRAILDWLDRCK